MKLPKGSILHIPDNKIAEYLLNPNHPDGKAKADFFLANGVDLSNSEYLKAALKQQLVDNEPMNLLRTTFGEKYVFESPIRFPNGKEHLIRSVWIMDRGSKTVNFVTAYRI